MKITWRVKILPIKKNVDRHFGKIRKLTKESTHCGELIKRLNAVIVGYKQFAKYTDAATEGMAGRWSKQLYMIISNWLRRQHKIYGKSPKVYKKVGTRSWVLYARTKKGDIHLDTYYRKGDSYGINQYIKVKGDKSPYDGDWIYWGNRSVGNKHISDKKLQLLRRQRGRCNICKGIFTPADVLHADHIIPKKKGGSSKSSNIQLLHQECHEKKTAKERAIK